MIQRLERMRTNDRCIITDQYMICFDRINNYYYLTGIRTANSPVPFQTGDYLNIDEKIDYAGLWEDMSRTISGDLEGDDDHIIAVSKDWDKENE